MSNDYRAYAPAAPDPDDVPPSSFTFNSNSLVAHVFGAGSSPTPQPQPPESPAVATPVVNAVDTRGRGLSVAAVALATLALACACWTRYDLTRPNAPAPSPAVPAPDPEGVKLGRSFVNPLASSLADGMDAGAAKIDAGSTVDDARTELQAKFSTSRDAAFAAKVGPALQKVVPAGSEPADDAARKAYSALLRSIAAGLRKGD